MIFSEKSRQENLALMKKGVRKISAGFFGNYKDDGMIEATPLFDTCDALFAYAQKMKIKLLKPAQISMTQTNWEIRMFSGMFCILAPNTLPNLCKTAKLRVCINAKRAGAATLAR